LKEIRRLYVQEGKVVPTRKGTLPGLTDYDSVSDEFCTAQKTLFKDPDDMKVMGGMKGA
jgi:cellulose 1,4-beta-cellobiosidase